MQELHAAVVDHEAESAKRHSVISLANDVKYWNIRRKRELLIACLKVVKEQKRASEKSVAAWNHLKDGLLDAPDAFITRQFAESRRKSCLAETMDLTKSALEENVCLEISRQLVKQTEGTEANGIPCLDCNCFITSTSESVAAKINHAGSIRKTNILKAPSLEDVEDNSIFNDALSSSTSISDVQNVDEDHRFSETQTTGENVMTDSMQSLVDGLLSWGGGNWENEDNFELALPRSMVTCLAIEQIDGLALQ
jgi:hypothetical protein